MKDKKIKIPKEDIKLFKGSQSKIDNIDRQIGTLVRSILNLSAKAGFFRNEQIKIVDSLVKRFNLKDIDKIDFDNEKIIIMRGRENEKLSR